MRWIFAALLYLVANSAFSSDELAICNSPLTGYSYYPFEQPTKLVRDKVSESKITVRKNDDKLDVLYSDSSPSIKSATQEGAKVLLLEASSKDFTIGLFYPGELTEIYVFSKSGLGNTVALTMAHAGDIPSFPKSSLLVGTCQMVLVPR